MRACSAVVQDEKDLKTGIVRDLSCFILCILSFIDEHDFLNNALTFMCLPVLSQDVKIDRT